ncbi:MAG: hypothetical protein JOZ02_11825 [Acidobacteria bacterium]|nr:hypothetical protein [Acidobacteriota bacterium]
MLQLVTVGLVLLGVYLLYAAVRTRRVVRARGGGRRLRAPSVGEDHEKNAWIQVELDRAWSLIESRDEGEVIAGLQILAALGSSITHLYFFRRVLALTQDANAQIAEHARLAFRKVARLSKGS